MSTKYKYGLLVIILHVVIGILTYKLLAERKILFILSEFLLILSLYLCYRIYRSFIKPIEMMRRGTIALQERDINIRYVKTGSKEIDFLIDLYNELLDNLRLERTKSVEQSYFLENVIMASPVGVVLLDFDNKVSILNQKAKSLLGINKDYEGLTMSQLNSPIAKSITEQGIGESKSYLFSGNQKLKVNIASVIHKGFTRKFVVIEEMTKEILEAEKAAYGKVIRMMAHEVNNSIGAINSILETTIGHAFAKENEWTEALSIAKDRNTNLNQFMFNFAKVLRVPDAELQKIDIGAWLESQKVSIKHLTDQHDIKLVLKTDLECIVHMDTSLMYQVLTNVLKNAIEACKPNNTIQISALKNPSRLLIQNNGKTLSPEESQKIFTPFYSSKSNGQGIGLMVIKEIAERHNAKCSLHSASNGWTTFMFEFAK